MDFCKDGKLILYAILAIVLVMIIYHIVKRCKQCSVKPDVVVVKPVDVKPLVLPTVQPQQPSSPAIKQNVFANIRDV